MPTFGRIAAAISALVLPLTALSVPQAQAASSTCSEFTVAVTSVRNPATGTRLLTQWDAELSSARQYGFTENEGIAFAVASAPATGLVGVWRLYHPATSDFTWAAEGADVNAMLQAGYQKQFLQFYAATVGNQCTAAQFRARKGDDTRIVSGTVNRDAAVRDGWTILGQVFFAPASPVTAPAPVVDDDFTIVAIPDTQQETWTDSDPRMRNRAQWIANNADAQDIAFVTQVGDLVDWGAVAPEQFTRARNGMAPLVGKVPWSATLGNHDTAAVCAGGSACPGANTSVTVRDTTAFNRAFPASAFARLAGQFEPGKIDNAYHTFNAGGQDFLVLNLELWPRPAAVSWAKTVVQQHPRHNVIVSTHSYLNSDGSIGTSNGGYGSTSPRYLYDNLIKLYPNVVMVLSGHVGGGASRVDSGVSGNRILSLLQTYHDRKTNPMRLISIDVGAGTVTHRVYAPYTNQTLQAPVTVTGLDFTR